MLELKRVEDMDYIFRLFRSIAKYKEIPVSTHYRNEQTFASMFFSSKKAGEPVLAFDNKRIMPKKGERLKISFFFKDVYFIFEAEVDCLSEKTCRLGKPEVLSTSYKRVAHRYKFDMSEEAFLLFYGKKSRYRLVDISSDGLSFESEIRLFMEGQTVRNLTVYLPGGVKACIDAVVKYCRQDGSGKYILGVYFTSMEWMTRQVLFKYIFEKTYPYLKHLKEFSVEQLYKLYDEARYLSLKSGDENDTSFADMVKCLEGLKDKPVISSSLAYYKNGRLLTIGSAVRVYNRTFFGNRLVSVPGARLNLISKTDVYIGLVEFMLANPYFEYYFSYIVSDIPWHREMFKNAEKFIGDREKLLFDTLHFFECETEELKVRASSNGYRCEVLEEHGDFINYCNKNLDALESGCYGYSYNSFGLSEIRELYDVLGYSVGRRLWAVYREGSVAAYIVAESYTEGLNLYNFNDGCRIYFTGEEIDANVVLDTAMPDVAMFFKKYGKSRFNIWFKSAGSLEENIKIEGIKYVGEAVRVMMNRHGSAEYKKLMLSNLDYITRYYPLTYPQRAVWYTEKVYPERGIGNITGTIRLKGGMDYRLLEKAINMAIEKNEGLRLRISEENDEPRQYVCGYEFVKIDFYDFSESGINDFYKWEEEQNSLPFKMTESDLYYFALIKINENDGGLLLKIHHIISDAWTMMLLANQIIEYYVKLKQGITVSKAARPSYIEYVFNEEEYKYSDRLDESRRFWNGKFSAFPEFTGLKPERKKYRNTEADRKTFIIRKDLVLRIQDYCFKTRVSVFVFFISALYVYLYRVTSKKDMVVGTPILNRSGAKEKNTAGMFVSTIPVRAYVDCEMSFNTFARYMYREIMSCLKNQRYPYELILKDFREKHKAEDKLYDIVFSYQNARLRLDPAIGEYDERWHFSGNQTESLTIHLSDREDAGEYIVNFDYLKEDFTAYEVERIYGHLLNILEDAAKNPLKKIYELEMLSPEEKRRLLFEFNDTAVDYPKDKTIHELFEKRAAEAPDNIAVVFKDKKLTYKELNEKSNRLAGVLRKKGVRPDTIAGIMTEPSMEMIVGMLAILKAGGAFLPIDASYPRDRIEYMLKDSGACFLLTLCGLPEHMTYGGDVINLMDEELYSGSPDNLEAVNKPGDLAYVIYTSGSTGEPKGVLIEHKALLNLSLWHVEYYAVTPLDRASKYAGFGFDASVWEIFPYIMAGASIFIISNDIRLDIFKLNDYFEANGITIGFLPTQICEQFMMLDNKSLRKLLTGGDKLRNFVKRDYELVNNYGPTESAVVAASFRVTAGLSDIPVGRPIYNTRIYILDSKGSLQPVGVPGELCISGEGLARGYLNRNELTQKKFVSNPYAPGEAMYKTGDMARWLPDGNIEFLGRLDRQVKIRGFRIEPGEIEKQLLGYGPVKAAVVVDEDDREGNKFLCAYVVLEHELVVSDIKNYLSKVLPQYMIPSYFVQLDSIPLSANGKVDRKGLPAPYACPADGQGYAEPENDMEKSLADIWGRALKADKIGVRDNFFQLGGHSISMMQVINSIQREFGVRLSYADFVENSTITELARIIRQNEINGKLFYKDEALDSVNLYSPFPLTNIQAAYLIGRNGFFEMGGISTQAYAEIKTEMDMERFNLSLRKVIERHSMLHAVILPDGRQEIMKYIPEYNIDVRDISDLGEEEKYGLIEEERQEMMHSAFKAGEWPLFEFRACKLSDRVNHMLVRFDPLIADATSIRIIARELAELYNNPDALLPELEYSFRDYVLAYERLKESEIYSGDKAYWLNKLGDFPPAPELPLKCNPEKVLFPHFKRKSRTLEKGDWEKLKRKAQEKGITASMVLCAAYAETLGLWSNQERFAINLTVFNRYPFHKDVEKVVGDFTSIILLEADMRGKATFWDRAESIRGKLLEGLEHRCYDGIEFIREISRYHNMGTKAVMPVVFTSILSDNDSGDGWYGLGEIKTAVNRTSQVYIDNQVSEAKGELLICWDYVEEIFDEDIIDGMFEHYVNILAGLIYEDSGYCFKLSKRDREIVEAYNRTDEKIEAATLQQLFYRQCGRTPDKTAVEFGGEYITYGELNKRSNQVAFYLRSRGVKPNDLICITVNRCIETTVNILGILKSGAAYVPIEPSYPGERIDYILESSKCRMAISSSLYSDMGLFSYPSSDLEDINSPDDTAYVIYTSGSTGKPKGVVITHGAVSNTIIDINKKFNVDENDKILGISSMCFDLSVYDIFGAFSAGATLVLVQDQRNVLDLINTLDKKKITVWNSVPAIMNMTVDNLNSGYINTDLRLVLLSGDWIPIKLPGKIKKYFANADQVSLGGATEAAIWSIYHRITEVKEHWNSIPYGVPLANQRFYVLNHNMEICPAGVKGELYIGGVGLAKGYLYDDEKTKKAFIRHPELGRVYKTGDCGVLHREGVIEFLGRKDSQVKIRGYRVELGEIENVLVKHGNIKNAVVVCSDNSNKSLCAYFVSDKEICGDELKAYLLKELPDYMVPSYFCRMDKIPLNPNGKLERSALPEIRISEDKKTDFEMPANETERIVSEIWRSLLNVRNVGINDNFFETGATSLEVINLFSRIFKEFGLEIPISEIYARPTVKQLSEYIAINKKVVHTPKDNDLILIKKGTYSKRNIFFIHDGSGGIEAYIELCNNISCDLNYWGIRFDEPINPGPKKISIHRIAKGYLGKMKSVQPEGPYYVAGWSLGGVIAFEISAQLEDAGEKVDFLAVFDSDAPVKEESHKDPEISINGEIDLIKRFTGSDDFIKNVGGLCDIDKLWALTADFMERNNVGNETVKSLLPEELAELVPDYRHLTKRELVVFLNTLRTLLISQAIYRPEGRVKTQIHYFKASQSDSDGKAWERYTEKPVKIYTVEGTHFSIFKKPDVNEFSKKFDNLLYSIL